MKKKIDIEIMDKKQIPQSEPERQYYFMDIAKNYVEQLAAKKGSPLTFHVTTFGCQMNARDSEKLRAHRLCGDGYGGRGFCYLQYLHGA